MQVHEYATYDAVGLAQLVKQGDITATELLDCALSAADKLNPVVNAICDWYVDEALEVASNPGLEGAFAGVPFLIKDLVLQMKGVPCRQGCGLTPNRSSPRDSELMARFRKSGLVTFGRTTTPAFGAHVATASYLHGETLNPWNTSYSPGGSSGGAAAAVASGIVPVAHANDGLGSIRIPSAACGLFGLKPTKQRTPTGPDYGDLLFGRGVEFVVCRTVRDAAVLLDQVHGPDAGAPHQVPTFDLPFASALARHPAPLRIAFTHQSFSGKPVASHCANAADNMAALCETLGHHVVEAAPKFDWEAYMQGLFVSVVAGLHAALHPFAQDLGADPAERDVEPYIWSMYQQGSAVSGYELIRAQSLLATTQRSVGHFFNNFDVLITPTLSNSPLKAGGGQLDLPLDSFWSVFAGDALSPFAGLFNVTGQPAASIPAPNLVNGLPVGVQLVGQFGREDVLLSLAGQIEKAAPWAQRRPSIHAGSI